MEKDKEKWISRIKDKLSDHSELVSDNLLDRILKDASSEKVAVGECHGNKLTDIKQPTLEDKSTNIKQDIRKGSAEDMKQARHNKVMLYIRYAAAACIAVLLCVGVLEYFNKKESMTNDSATQIAKITKSDGTQASSENELPVNKETQYTKDKDHTKKSIKSTKEETTDGTTTQLTANNEITDKTITGATTQLTANNEESNKVKDIQLLTDYNTLKNKIGNNTDSQKYKLSEKELFGNSVDELEQLSQKNKKSHKREDGSNSFKTKGTMLAMYTGGNTILKSEGSKYDYSYNNQDNFVMTGLAQIKLENNTMEPYQLLNKSDLDYKMPVSFGISASKYLNNRISAESGLYFTKLTTQFANDHKSQQQLWYVGVPLRIGYSLYSTEAFELYTSAGGSIEMCISAQYKGKYPETKLSDIPLQFSLNASAGAQYHFTPWVGLYVEPGISHYFNTQKTPYTYRSQHPTSFNINFGLRFTIP